MRRGRGCVSGKDGEDSFGGRFRDAEPGKGPVRVPCVCVCVCVCVSRTSVCLGALSLV